MKKSLKFISLLTAFLLTISAIVACESPTNEESSEQNVQENPTVTDSDTDFFSNEESSEQNVQENPTVTDSNTDFFSEVVVETEPPRPTADYATDFFLLIHADSNVFDYHWVAESSNDVLSQAIFDRQQKIATHLGVNIVGTKALSSSSYIEPFKNAVKNKDGSIDTLLTHVYHGIDGFVAGNYLTDFNDIPEINLDADYWNRGIMEEASLNGNMYLAKSDFNILYTFAIAFNKDIMDKYDDTIDESVYDMVNNYHWTLDNMIKIANLVYTDSSSDGKTTTDTFGIVGQQNIPFIGFLNACNINLVDLNEKGEYVLSFYSDVNRENSTNIIEKIKALVSSDCSWFWPFGSTDIIQFEKGTSLLYLSSTNDLPGYLNYDISFGVLPYPMYNEAQKDVGYRSLQWGGYTCVPSYVDDITMVGDTLEMLAFYSSSVNEAFYEKLLGKQVAEAPMDKKMLDIIWDGICTDFAQTYYSALINSNILYMVPELTKTSSTQNIASYAVSTEKSLNKLLKKLTAANN